MLLRTFFMIGYFASWSAYPDMGYSVDQLDLTKLLHVMYAFALPSKTGEIFLPDPEIDYGDTSDSILRDGSANFLSIVTSSSKRDKFILTSISLMNDLGMDGLDLYWKFPKNEREAKNYVTLLQELRIVLDIYKIIKDEKEKYLLS
ncbi:10416_t:CDS:2, partial [Ambispora leptoticha]